jgi:4-hydroxy-2-oxoheptanedioate aldolase
MQVNRLIFLDFDGVLFDTVKEAYAIAMLTHSQAKSIKEIDFNSHHYYRFRSLRYLIGPASDYLFLIPSINNSTDLKSAEESYFKSSNTGTDFERQRFTKEFFDIRTSIREKETRLWNSLNPEFEFFVEISILLNKFSDKFCIVTTKDKGAVKQLFKHYGVDADLAIYDADTFVKYKSKKSIIEFLMDDKKIDHAIFIDDSSHHLSLCKDIKNLVLMQPSWGYLPPGVEGVRITYAVEQIKRFLGIATRNETFKENSMYGIEGKMYVQLCKLRDEYNLKGIKAEFEAEGSSLRDLMRLRRITNSAGIDLFLKIGGVEAVRDIKDSLEIAVDGLIAPMCETPFGVKKFIDAYKEVYGEHKIHLSINVETKSAVDNLEAIINIAEGFIDNITIGRSDLSASYSNEEVTPDSDFIFDILSTTLERLASSPMTLTVGGSISIKTVEEFKKRQILVEGVSKLETRKVMLPPKEMIYKNAALVECLKFEELYILAKKEIQDLFISSEIKRLTKLQGRLA